MRLLVATGFAIAICSLTAGQTAGAAPESTQDPKREYKLTSVVDGVKVPLNVLVYAQTEYQGHAVTKVRKISRGGDQAYQLRVDRDSLANDYDSFHLIYDKDWKLVDDKEILPPPKPKVEREEPEPVAKPAENDETEREKPESQAQRGGRGGDSDHSDEVIDRVREHEERREENDEDEDVGSDGDADKKNEGTDKPSAAAPQDDSSSG